MKEIENPRAKGEKCRAIYIGGTGIEWICIREPHNKGYKRRTGDLTHRRGEIVYGTGAHLDGPDRGGRAATADQHYFVNRWPNRKREDDG